MPRQPVHLLMFASEGGVRDDPELNYSFLHHKLMEASRLDVERCSSNVSPEPLGVHCPAPTETLPCLSTSPLGPSLQWWIEGAQTGLWLTPEQVSRYQREAATAEY
ncbi:unnamed protein product [Phytophthora lilii]|uniref:Unnamed protein product n=1 Tax=Phytophthora lilii TaxID=2077276 RepID=A0A9W7CPS9_9STRA|nr:unnamed protein product [Phytophthora lilii]